MSKVSILDAAEPLLSEAQNVAKGYGNGYCFSGFKHTF
jgi:hypothetical protein